jgi:hypothetical protein
MQSTWKMAVISTWREVLEPEGREGEEEEEWWMEEGREEEVEEVRVRMRASLI